jgi:hypothetical protein
MADLEQKKFASMVRMLQTAYPRDWELHLYNLGVTASTCPPSDDLDRILERVFWMVRQAGIKNPAAWMKFDMGQAEASSEPVKLNDPPKSSTPRGPNEHDTVKLEIGSAGTIAPSLSGPEGGIREPSARDGFDSGRAKDGSASAEREAPQKTATDLARAKSVNPGAGPAKDYSAPPLTSDSTIEIAKLLSQTRVAIEAGNKREAVRAMFEAQEKYGVRQQKIATAVGKTQPWVSGMLRWHRKEFKDTPFGPASKDGRVAARMGRRMGRKLPRGLVRRWVRTRLAPNRTASGVLVIKRGE